MIVDKREERRGGERREERRGTPHNYVGKKEDAHPAKACLSCFSTGEHGEQLRNYTFGSTGKVTNSQGFLGLTHA